ncbi:hypothetical protein [Marmoricola endophyticus]|nr:hypothetical protein [Marmoricola endophyticus]
MIGRRVACALVVVLGLSSCTLHPEERVVPPESDVSLATAQRRLDTMLHTVAEETFGPGARLQPQSGAVEYPSVRVCADYSDAPPGSPYSANYSYRVGGIALVDRAQAEEYAQRVANALTERGWTERDGYPSGDRSFGHQNYGILFQTSPDGVMYLVGSTPCVKKNGD